MELLSHSVAAVLFYDCDVFLNDGSTLVSEASSQELLLLSSEKFIASKKLSILLEHGGILDKGVLSEVVLEASHFGLLLFVF